MKYDDISYLSFEGGGGKAIVYLGALRVLEKVGVLPYRSAIDGRLKGVSGSSGGAITAFFVALGLDSDEIQDRTENDDFGSFLDEPERGFYKAVMYDTRGDGTNRSGYTVSHFKTVGDDLYAVNDGNTAFFYEDVDVARQQGRRAAQLKQSKAPAYSAMTQLLASIIAPIAEAATRDERQSPVMNKLLSLNPAKTIHYCHSLLYDRGIFAGVAVREYFTSQMTRYMQSKYGATLTVEQAQNLTFADFQAKTHSLDFRVVSTNITLGKPKTFSAVHTPDFPVVDAVCMSMSLPGVFRPTFVDAVVDKSKIKSDPEYLKDYMGFYFDGGATNNLPIHVFDSVAYVDRKKVFVNGVATEASAVDQKDAARGLDFPIVALSDAVLGVRCTGGPDNRFFKAYTGDDVYKKFQSLNPKKKGGKAPEKITYDDASLMLTYVASAAKPVSTLLDFVGTMYDMVMYYTEAGQIPTVEEASQTIELFSYDVGLLDFALTERYQKFLSTFVQRTAAIKLASYFGLFDDKEDSYAKIVARAKVSSGLNPEAARIRQDIIEMLIARYDISQVK